MQARRLAFSIILAAIPTWVLAGGPMFSGDGSVYKLLGGQVTNGSSATTGQVLTKQANGSLAFATPITNTYPIAPSAGTATSTGAGSLVFGAASNDAGFAATTVLGPGLTATAANQTMIGGTLTWPTGLGANFVYAVGPSDNALIINAGSVIPFPTGGQLILGPGTSAGPGGSSYLYSPYGAVNNKASGLTFVGGDDTIVGGPVGGFKPYISTNSDIIPFDDTVGSGIAVLGSSTSTNTAFRGLYLGGATSGTLGFQAAAVTTPYVMTWPGAHGGAGTVLTDAAGNGTLSWATPSVSPWTRTGTVISPTTVTDSVTLRGPLSFLTGSGGVNILNGPTDQPMTVVSGAGQELQATGQTNVRLVANGGAGSVIALGAGATGNTIAWDGLSWSPSVNGSASVGAASVGFNALYIDYTNTATVGNVTINKASGTVNLAAVGSTLTVTNSKVTAKSHVMVTLASDPGVALVIWTVGAAGSFTINTRPATVNQVAIDFLVVGAD